MNILKWFKSFLPHLIATAIFLVISGIYFYPQIEGKILRTNDGTVARDASREIRDFREKTGEEALWTNVMFGGMPAYLISVKYSGNIIKAADRIIRIVKLPIGSIFLTMLGFYILLLIFRVQPWLAIAGAIAYGFSTYFFFILSAGHNTKAIAIAYMAPVIGSVYYTYRRDALKGALMTGFFLALQIVANHPQITYYAFLCLFIFVVTEFIWAARQKQLSGFIRSSLILIIPVILAVGMNFASLYTTYEYGKYSIRGKSELISDKNVYTSGLNKDYATQWSYGIDETFNLLIPDFKGGGNIPFDRDSETVMALKQNNAGQYADQFSGYWGTQPGTDGPVYVGAIVIFLFVLGLITVKGAEKWWLLTATILSIMLAWGKNFMFLTNIFMDYFPGYNKFRAVTMTLVIAEFCIPLLGILALKNIFDGTTSRKEFIKGLKIALGITGGITLLFFLVPGLAGSFLAPHETEGLPEWLTSALVADRKEMVRSDAFRSLIFVLLGAALLLGFYYEKIRKEYAIILFAALFLFDMFPVNKRYMRNEKFVTPAASRKASSPTPADNEILKDQSVFRVLNLTVSPFNDASTSLYHMSVGGYHGAKIRRYNELIDSVLYPEINRFISTAKDAKSLSEIEPALQNLPGLNMLNTRYLILNPTGAPLRNNYSAGNAWFAEEVLLADNANQELSMVREIKPHTQVVVDKKFSSVVKNLSYPTDSTDNLSLISYKPNELVYSSQTTGERLAVFSEIWYPEGWKAYLDGKEHEYFRANYVLRAMVLPAGNHEIKFEFRPSSFYTGEKISLASSVIFMVLVAGWIISHFYKRKGATNGTLQ